MKFLTAQEQRALAVVLGLLLVGMTVKLYRGAPPELPATPPGMVAPGP